VKVRHADKKRAASTAAHVAAGVEKEAAAFIISVAANTHGNGNTQVDIMHVQYTHFAI